MTTRRLIGIGAAAAVMLAACGGSSSDDVANATTPAATSPDTGADTIPDATSAGDTTATSDTTATTDPIDTTTSATVTPVAAPEPFDLATLPDLILAADSAIDDPTVDPFEVVVGLIGFPLPIPAPAGSSLWRFEAEWSVDSDSDGVDGSARYDVIGAGGTVDDIDITLDDNGPGSQQLIDLFDPIMTDLGFERTNSTASDPGDPGGPNSVNHVYVTDEPVVDVNGAAITLAPLFVWSTEDANGWAYDATRPELGGFSVDVRFDAAAAMPTPFPMADALLDAFPVPAAPTDMALSDVAIRLQQRSADSYSIDDGASYVEVIFTWLAPAESFDEVAAFYTDPTIWSDEAVFMAGEEDFFAEGTAARTEPYQYDGTDLRLDVLLLQQYGGLFGIDASDDGIEPTLVTLRLTLNPNDIRLSFPAE